jgi:hypothetical protein
MIYRPGIHITHKHTRLLDCLEGDDLEISISDFECNNGVMQFKAGILIAVSMVLAAGVTITIQEGCSIAACDEEEICCAVAHNLEAIRRRPVAMSKKEIGFWTAYNNK